MQTGTALAPPAGHSPAKQQPEATTHVLLAEHFEKDRIVEVKLAGFGPGGRGTAKARVHRDLADVLRQAFDEIASLGLSYRLNAFGPHSTYSFRYGTGKSNFKRFTTSGEYAGVAGKETWNVVYARHDRAHHRMQKPVTYLSGGKALETKTEAVAELGEHLTLKLDVPAAADVVRLRSKRFRIDLAPPPPPEGAKPDAKAGEKARASINQARRALSKSVTGRRWRDLALEHLNEWTSANLDKYIATKIKAAYFDSTKDTDRQKLCKELEEKLAPLTWYAAPKATEQPHGEKTALGEGARQPSIFGGEGSALPQDGHLQSMHPATALWLLDLLLEEGKVALQDAWPTDNLIAETVADDPPFLAVVEPSGGAAVGAEVALALVQHGYQLSSTCADSGVAFVAHPEKQKPRILALASYVDGAAVARVRFPFWGKTEIGVRAQGKDDTGARDLKPKAKGQTVLDLPTPESKGMQLSLARVGTGKPKDRQWAGTILVKEGCPQALEGYLAFTYWEAGAGGKPDFSRAGLPGNRLWPAVAERASDEEHERDGLRLKGDFVVGLADKKGKKVSARAARLSADYVLADFMNQKVAEAEGAGQPWPMDAGVARALLDNGVHSSGAPLGSLGDSTLSAGARLLRIDRLARCRHRSRPRRERHRPRRAGPPLPRRPRPDSGRTVRRRRKLAGGQRLAARPATRARWQLAGRQRLAARPAAHARW